MTLTSQQQQAMEKFKAFIADKDRQVFILKGYAGTGKTTLIRCMAEYLHTLLSTNVYSFVKAILYIVVEMNKNK